MSKIKLLHWTLTHLHSAAQHGDLARMRTLLKKGVDINRFDEIGKTPLHYAVEYNQLAAVELLLESGADVNAHDERVLSNTPLGDNSGCCTYAMARLLIEAGADPTIRGWMQLDALDNAVDRQDDEGEKVRELLKNAATKREGS